MHFGSRCPLKGSSTGRPELGQEDTSATTLPWMLEGRKSLGRAAPIALFLNRLGLNNGTCCGGFYESPIKNAFPPNVARKGWILTGSRDCNVLTCAGSFGKLSLLPSLKFFILRVLKLCSFSLEAQIYSVELPTVALLPDSDGKCLSSTSQHTNYFLIWMLVWGTEPLWRRQCDLCQTVNCKSYQKQIDLDSASHEACHHMPPGASTGGFVCMLFLSNWLVTSSKDHIVHFCLTLHSSTMLNRNKCSINERMRKKERMHEQRMTHYGRSHYNLSWEP